MKKEYIYLVISIVVVLFLYSFFKKSDENETKETKKSDKSDKNSVTDKIDTDSPISKGSKGKTAKELQRLMNLDILNLNSKNPSPIWINKISEDGDFGEKSSNTLFKLKGLYICSINLYNKTPLLKLKK